MNRFFISILMLFSLCLTSMAQQRDAEGWPIYWLRGDMTNWNCNDQYKFTRDGSKYTLHVSHLNDGVTFKPATSNWEYGYGTYKGENPATPDFEITTQYRSDKNNFKVQGGWDNFDITFEAPQNPDYEEGKDAVKLSIRSCTNPDHSSAGGDTDIDDGNWPDFYLRIGDFNGNLGAEQYKFSRSGNEYTLYVNGKLPGNYNNWFKISTNDDYWSINYGTFEETPTDLPFAIKTVFQGMDNNFKNKGWENFDIKFKYDRNNNRNCPVVYFLPHNYQGELPQPVIPGISGTLPVLYINVKNADGSFNNEVIDYDLNHKNYFSGEYWLDMNGVEWMGAKSIGSAEEPLPLEIKARGNYTRQCFAKKPFKLKLGKKQKMLGLTNSKHFAILAHADDDMGFLRNFVGFNLGRRMGLPWTPDQQPVEVVINGDYRGLYFLTESIRVGDNRVMIEELDDNVSDMALVTGGYVVEFDNYEDTNQIRLEHKACVDDIKFPLYVTYDTPEVYSEQQHKFVYDQMNAMNNLIPSANQESGNKLWSYLDLDDAVRYYLVEEIISHYEAYHGSTYLFRDRGLEEKWHFSPLWDCGHAFEGGTQNYFYKSSQSMGNTWIRSLRENSRFNDKLRETWKWFMSNKYEGLMKEIDTYCEHIKEAAKADYKRWQGITNTAGWERPTAADNRDMDGKKNYVKQYLADKINWLKGQWGDYTAGTFTEPERDATPAVKLDDMYISAYGVDYKWKNLNFNFENRPLVFDRNSNTFAKYSLGTLNSAYDASYVSKEETTVEVWKDSEWKENWKNEYDNASVEVNDNGEIYLNAPVPGVYNIKIVLNENRETKPWTRRAEKSVTASILPHMDDLSISNVDFSTDPVVVDWVNVNQHKLTADYPLPFEFFYTVKYADPTQDATETHETPQFAPVLRGGADYPYDLENKYENVIDLRYALEADMAVKVNGVVSPLKHVVFDAISTYVEEVDAAEDEMVRYFRLDGTETTTPLSKGIYIRVSGTKAEKILVD